MQKTLAQPLTFEGVGLHSGKVVHMTLKPAPTGHGIVFMRTDLENQDNVIPAKWDHVVDTQLCTVIANKDGASIGTIEHLMAALRGCHIDNVLIELDAPEVPIMDGSSAIFVRRIDEVGVVSQTSKRRYVKILKDISIEDNGSTASLSPDNVSRFTGHIDFDHPVIGQQDYEVKLVNGYFRHDIANCRTFGFLKDVEYLQKNGLAQGGSLDNAIVLDQANVLNKDGLRHDDEFIRHKLLDAIGDLYLAGAPILGAYHAEKPSHSINNKLLHALFSQPDAYTIIEMDGPDSDDIDGSHCSINLNDLTRGITFTQAH